MAYKKVECIYCKSQEVWKYGKNGKKKQRYKCKKCKKSFILKYSKKGWMPEIREKIIKMAMNGSGIRDTARVLSIHTGTVMSHIKKSLKSGQIELGEA